MERLYLTHKNNIKTPNNIYPCNRTLEDDRLIIVRSPISPLTDMAEAFVSNFIFSGTINATNNYTQHQKWTPRRNLSTNSK